MEITKSSVISKRQAFLKLSQGLNLMSEYLMKCTQIAKQLINNPILMTEQKLVTIKSMSRQSLKE